MIPMTSAGITTPANYLVVMYNGRIIGRVDPCMFSPLLFMSVAKAEHLATQLRLLKLSPPEGVTPLPIDTEICYIPPEIIKGGQYPGIFISNDAARFIRPVRHLQTNKIEFIGALEQVRLRSLP